MFPERQTGPHGSGWGGEVEFLDDIFGTSGSLARSLETAAGRRRQLLVFPGRLRFLALWLT